jgi:hypothetical protein
MCFFSLLTAVVASLGFLEVAIIVVDQAGVVVLAKKSEVRLRWSKELSSARLRPRVVSGPATHSLPKSYSKHYTSSDLFDAWLKIRHSISMSEGF